MLFKVKKKMLFKKLENFVEKLNQLKGLIQINSERNINFINYLKTNECRENKLKIYLSGSICDLKQLHLIEYNHYSSVELLKGVYKLFLFFFIVNDFFPFYPVLHTLIEIGTILEEIEPIHYCETLKITLKTIKMMLAEHNCEKFHEAIECFIRSFKICEKLEKGIQNKDEQQLKLVNFHMKIISHGLLRMFNGRNFIGIRSLIADFVGVEIFCYRLKDFNSKMTVNDYRKEFRTIFWELLENPTLFKVIIEFQLIYSSN